MSKIFIIRHGQDTDNVQKILNGRHDTELTDLGKEQARQAAKNLRSELKAETITAVYVSPLKRCRQTADIITQELGLPPAEIHQDLTERDFGFFTGQKVADIRKLSDDYIITDQVDYFLSGEGVEQFPDVYQRALKVMDLMKTKHLAENIVLVTHGDFGKMLRAAYYGWTWEQGLKTPYFANTEILTLQ